MSNHLMKQQQEVDINIFLASILFVHCSSKDLDFLRPEHPPLSLFSLTILSVSLLHSVLTLRPSYLAGKGEELRT